VHEGYAQVRANGRGQGSQASDSGHGKANPGGRGSQRTGGFNETEDAKEISYE